MPYADYMRYRSLNTDGFTRYYTYYAWGGKRQTTYASFRRKRKRGGVLEGMAGPLLSLRQAIIQRVQDKPADELTEVIEDSIGADERTLPGLGVLFELIWPNIDQTTQQTLVSALEKSLQS